jgi:hypothetical protein
MQIVDVDQKRLAAPSLLLFEYRLQHVDFGLQINRVRADFQRIPVSLTLDEKHLAIGPFA